MNYARIVGKVVDRLSTYDGFIYMVRTCRSGNKKVYDEMFLRKSKNVGCGLPYVMKPEIS